MNFWTETEICFGEINVKEKLVQFHLADQVFIGWVLFLILCEKLVGENCLFLPRKRISEK